MYSEMCRKKCDTTLRFLGVVRSGGGMGEGMYKSIYVCERERGRGRVYIYECVI